MVRTASRRSRSRAVSFIRLSRKLPAAGQGRTGEVIAAKKRNFHCGARSGRLAAGKARAAEMAFIDQVDEAHVALIEGVVPGRGMRGLRLAAQLAIHGEPLGQDRA